MTDGEIKLNWRAPGPVAAAFMKSEAKIQAILGPQGSGKTSAALMKLLRLGRLQPPGPYDNIRRFRACAVRDTYRQLWKTTIPSWWQWVPQNAPGSEWVGSTDGPARHRLLIDLPDETRLDFQIEFVAIGDNSAEDVLRGYEVTAFYLNEADLLEEAVLQYARGRTGRFPKKVGGFEARWHGCLIDFNAPDIDNYLYRICVEKKLPNLEFFQQPSGFSPRAENVQNLVTGYYEDMAAGQPDWWVRRMVRAQWGYSRDGKPVYEKDYSDDLHVAREVIRPNPMCRLGIGVDAGRTPAAIFGQQMPSGQIQWQRELVCENFGAKSFGEEIARTLHTEYPGWEISQIDGWGDPAAAYPGDQDDRSWLEIVSEHSGVPFMPAPVDKNDLTIRLEAVRNPLQGVTGGIPNFLLCPSCSVTRKGFNSHYRYKKLKIANSEKYDTKPDKNDHSHPHDAGQYLNVGLGAHLDVLNRHSQRQSANHVRQTHAITDENPQGRYAAAQSRQKFAIT